MMRDTEKLKETPYVLSTSAGDQIAEEFRSSSGVQRAVDFIMAPRSGPLVAEARRLVGLR